MTRNCIRRACPLVYKEKIYYAFLIFVVASDLNRVGNQFAFSFTKFSSTICTTTLWLRDDGTISEVTVTTRSSIIIGIVLLYVSLCTRFRISPSFSCFCKFFFFHSTSRKLGNYRYESDEKFYIRETRPHLWRGEFIYQCIDRCEFTFVYSKYFRMRRIEREKYP